jgi:hypothetical protein
VSLLGGINDEFDYQMQQRLREALRDLEKAVINSILTGNTIGSATARRTMKGLRQSITTNVQSVASANLNESWLGNTLKMAWSNGGTDIDTLVCGVNHKRIIDTFNSSRKMIANEENKFSNLVSEYESTFGLMRVVLCRWMPSDETLVLASQRVKVLPLNNRSFMFKEVASQGDSRKGMIIGEYTLEVRNEEGLSRLVGS